MVSTSWGTRRNAASRGRKKWPTRDPSGEGLRKSGELNSVAYGWRRYEDEVRGVEMARGRRLPAFPLWQANSRPCFPVSLFLPPPRS